MTALSPNDFATFFNEVYGYPPFPWQSRLTHRVFTEGRFPGTLDLPTGSGKTAAIDVAVFALAVDLAAGRRRLPCRIAFVVDRRTVVDQSFTRALKLADRLSNSEPGSVVRRVADQLTELAGTDEPLRVALLRGAVPRDDTWTSNPVQPTVLVSTVDQVGSRLFFRGYSVSDGMRPIHAGLLGNDVLLLLDEVHLARPFCDTLRMLERYHTNRIGRDLPRRFQVVELSATHRNEDDPDPFRLDAADRENKCLHRRLAARKPTTLELVKVNGTEPSRLAALAKTMAAAAAAALLPGNAVGVVVNRVQTARLIHADLSSRGLDADVRLLTGRMRPLDRQALEQQLQPRLATGHTRSPTQCPIILVTTQCIEAGADFDFDALITECASLDALHQRFGRLNRAGDLDAAAGTVFARSDIPKEDPIYGEAAAATWDYLRSLPAVDFRHDALPLPEKDKLVRLLAPASSSPILLPAHLEAWSQTAPAPFPDPDVALWLHGPQTPSPEVLVVWRADISEAELMAAEAEQHNTTSREAMKPTMTAIRERLDACTPLISEGLAVPVWAAKAWLVGVGSAADAVLSDVDQQEPRTTGADSLAARPVVVRRDGEYLAIEPKSIRAWDTVIVPTEYGGIRAGNWDPDAVEAVADLAEAAHLRQRGRAVVRLDERLWPGSRPPIPEDDNAEQGIDDREQIRYFLAGQVDAEDPLDSRSEDRIKAIRVLLEELGKRTGPRLIRVKGHDTGDRWVIVSRCLAAPAGHAPGLTSPDLALEDDELSLIGNAATLRTHLAGVGRLKTRRRFRAPLWSDRTTGAGP